MKEKSFTALGIDVGATKIALGAVRFPLGEVLRLKSIPTDPGRGSTAVLEDIVRDAGTLAAETSREGNSVSGVGIGICELINAEGQILSHNCLGWQREQVLHGLGDLGPVTIEADVRAAARAEALFGAGRSFHIFLYVTVGTGISSCLVLEGEPYVGSRGATGTMASSPLSWTCEQCGEINAQTLEDIASGPGLVRRFNQHRPGSVNSGEAVLAAAAEGDAKAVQVVTSAGRALASSVGLLVNVLDPQAVIVGGGLGLSGGLYWDTFVDSVPRHIWSEVHRDLPILRAATGVNAGLLGAAAACWSSRTDSCPS